jgi:hypothetical protein
LSLTSAIATRNALLTEAGKAALNMKYPKEFELYVIALELTDEQFNTLKYFIFPVNPSSLEEIKPKLTNVKKTLGGVTALKTPTFVPTDITLTGSFGRNFKVLLGTGYEDLIHSFQDEYISRTGQSTFTTSQGSVKQGAKQFFDDRVKTGYGCFKILEEIVDESVKVGKNLILHNPVFGNSYLVTAGSLRISMTEQTNMIINYSLPLKTIAPLESLYTKKQLESISKQLSVTNYFQKRTNALIKNISKIAAKGVEVLPQI